MRIKERNESEVAFEYVDESGKSSLHVLMACLLEKLHTSGNETFLSELDDIVKCVQEHLTEEGKDTKSKDSESQECLDILIEGLIAYRRKNFIDIQNEGYATVEEPQDEEPVFCDMPRISVWQPSHRMSSASYYLPQKTSCIYRDLSPHIRKSLIALVNVMINGSKSSILTVCEKIALEACVPVANTSATAFLFELFTSCSSLPEEDGCCLPEPWVLGLLDRLLALDWEAMWKVVNDEACVPALCRLLLEMTERYPGFSARGRLPELGNVVSQLCTSEASITYFPMLLETLIMLGEDMDSLLPITPEGQDTLNSVLGWSIQNVAARVTRRGGTREEEEQASTHHAAPWIHFLSRLVDPLWNTGTRTEKTYQRLTTLLSILPALPSLSPSNLLAILHKVASSTPRLTALCRRRLRQALNHRLELTGELPLPRALKDYVRGVPDVSQFLDKVAK